MLTFERDQFLAVAEVIAKMQRRLLAERETLKPQNTDSITATATFIM